MDAVPTGTFNYVGSKTYTPTEAIDVINGYLLQKGHLLVQRDEFLVCVSIEEGIPPNLVPTVTLEELPKRGKNELLNIILPVSGLDVDQAAKEIENLKGPQGKVVGLKSTQALVVTDIGSNLQRIASLLEGVSKRGGPNDVTFKAYPLKHVPAGDAEAVIRGLLGLTLSVTNVSASAEAARGGRDRGQGPPPAPVSSKSNAQITSDTRTNSLLVSAILSQHEIVSEALKVVDVEADAMMIASRLKRPYLQVYSTKSADVREVAKTLDAMLPGVVVNEDGQSKKLHIFGTSDQQAEVEALIQKMDGQGGAQQVAVIPLANMDAMTAAGTLRSMFIRDLERAPTIEPDMIGRQIMVRGNADQIQQVKTLLAELGEDGSKVKEGRRGKLRQFSLSGRDPQEVLPLLEKMWKSNGHTPIRVVTPQQRGPVKDLKVPAREGRDDMEGDSESNSEPQNSANPSAKKQSVPSPQLEQKSGRVRVTGLQVLRTGDRRHNITRSFVAADDGTTPAKTPKAAEAASPPPPDEPAPVKTAPRKGKQGQADAEQKSPPPRSSSENDTAPVTITILGGELILSANDPAELDQLEELLEDAMQVLPVHNSWTVFSLQSADATETATLLGQLFPDSKISSVASSGGLTGGLTSGLSSMGSSLMSMTGMSGMAGASAGIRIIPDTRLNALLVNGPAHRVRDIEEMLRVLDASDLAANNLRERTPRIIAVEHAEVRDVYEIVRDSFKDLIEPAQNPLGPGGANALAMMMGGGRGERKKESDIKMTIAMDSRTNQLIVSSSESLFRDVEKLVNQIDNSAKDARRTVRVVSLDGVETSVISDALGGLMPKVRITSTGRRSTANNVNNNNTNSDNSQNANQSTPNSNRPQNQPAQPTQPNPDEIRQMFQQRFRGGGGFGGGGFGGPGGGRRQ